MTGQRLPLEDFAVAELDGAQSLPEPMVDLEAIEAATEAARTEAYEKGYRTGWDDAVRAAEEERRNLGEELARNLRDLNFTYFEAREELLLGTRAFLREFLDSVFPALLSESTAGNLAEAIGDLARDLGSNEFAISVAPEDGDAVRSLMPLPNGAELTVAEEPALAPGQARLYAIDREVSIDATGIQSMLRDAISAQSPEFKE